MRLSTIASSVIEFLYPRQCAACRASIPEDESLQSIGSLCSDCGVILAGLEAAPFCDRCGMPSPEPDAPCAYCQGKGVPHFERIVRLGVFHDPLKHLIHQMKYHRRWPIAEMLAERLVAHESVKALLSETDVIVPVPLHMLRQISRGYNQADAIARTIRRKCKIPVVRALARVRRTPMQTGMTSATARAENMRDAFILDSDRRIRGKHIVVIDDVLTTGATLQSAARVLAQARPASMSAIVIAVADPKHQDFQRI